MDHKDFLSRIPPAELTLLNRRSGRAGLYHLAGHLGLLIVGAVWIGFGLPLWQMVLPVHGVILVFLFTLEHETTHRTPFAHDWQSDWVGRACGVLLLLPFEWFRYFHLAHHRHTNIEGKDPELDGFRGHLDQWGPFLWHVTGLPYWWGMAKVLVRNAAGRPDGDYLPPRAHGRIIREARVMLVVYIAAHATLWVSPLLFWIWLFPAILGQPALRLYLMAEHGRCPKVADMFDNTRTTYTNRVLRFLAWNMPYHTEHHVLPSVPFHNLPAVNRMINDHLQHESPGYTAFTRETLRRL